MIESGLYFAAGFLTAIIVAMIVAPAIWRRAVVLTRKRIENAVPLTVSELQADKDRLRAEHAIELRKKAVALKKQREITADHASQISALTVKLTEAQTAEAEVEGSLQAQTREADQLSTRLHEAETDLAETRLELGTLQATLEARAAEQEAMTRLHTETQSQLEKAREDLERQANALIALETRLGQARQKEREHAETARDSLAEMHQTAQLLKSETGRAEKLQMQLAEAESLQGALSQKGKRRKKKLEQMRDDRTSLDADFQELEQRAADAEAERAAIERELGAMTVRVGAIAKLLSGKKPEEAIQGMNAQIARLTADLEAERERAGTAEAQLAEIAAGEAALREQITTLAAQVVHMAAMLEGEGSPIPKLVAANGADSDGDMDQSLAARVRALREAALAEAAEDG